MKSRLLQKLSSTKPLVRHFCWLSLCCKILSTSSSGILKGTFAASNSSSAPFLVFFLVFCSSNCSYACSTALSRHSAETARSSSPSGSCFCAYSSSNEPTEMSGSL